VRSDPRGTESDKGESSHSYQRGLVNGARACPFPPAGSGGARRMQPARGKETEAMSSLTAWRFSSTEGADDAVLKLKRLDDQDLIDVQDAAVVRWPQYAGEPVAHEHVTHEGGMVSSIAKKLRHSNIDSSTVESIKGDMMPGTSALVLLSANATVDTVAKAFEGQSMELIRSDLSVQQEDRVRRVFEDPADAPQGQQPGDAPQGQQPGESQ
jgi:uncharacterized membrane protein